jgi:hypothetical protein
MTFPNGGQRDENHPNRQVGPEKYRAGEFVTTTKQRFYGDWDELHDRFGPDDND